MSQDKAQEQPSATPGGLWRIARVAAENVWDVAIVLDDNDHWRLTLTEDHHEFYICWRPTAQHPSGWKPTQRTFPTRCPQGAQVDYSELEYFLANHPDACEKTHDRKPLDQLRPATVHPPKATGPRRHASRPVAGPVRR